MKPFNLEEAKAVKKVVTRDGRNARIVSFNGSSSGLPITAMIETLGVDWMATYTISGSFLPSGEPNCLDLFMADDEPEPEAEISDLQKWCKEILHVVQAAANGDEIERLSGNVWVDKKHPALFSATKYRIKPKVKIVNGFEVPMHETVELNHAQEYFTPSIAASNMWTSKRWEGYKTDKNLLDRGMIYLDKYSAIKCAKAMLGIDPEDASYEG